jgi:hypothetical protein
VNDSDVAFYKSRNTTVGSHTTVQAEDHIGALTFNASDGANYAQAGQLKVWVDSAPSSGIVPGRFTVSLTNASGTPTEYLRIASGGNIYGPGIGTTASAANAFLNSGSTPANELLRSTSSLRYKTDVRPIPQGRLNALSTLAPIEYTSLAKADDPSRRFVGFAAEEVAAIDPTLVNWGYHADDWEQVERGEGDDRYTEMRLKEGATLRPDGVQYDRVLLMLVTAMRAEIEELKRRIPAPPTPPQEPNEREP